MNQGQNRENSKDINIRKVSPGYHKEDIPFCGWRFQAMNSDKIWPNHINLIRTDAIHAPAEQFARTFRFIDGINQNTQPRVFDLFDPSAGHTFVLKLKQSNSNRA